MVRLVLALALASVSGCLLDSDCRVDTYRCAGDELQICTGHPGGPSGPIDDPSYSKGSGPTWDKAADCGANRCIASAKPFCALDAEPDPACTAVATTGDACDGTTEVRCNAGYAMERTACRACDPSHLWCTGFLWDTCAIDTDCAAGMICRSQTCEQPCACPEGASCAACIAVEQQSADPHLGVALDLTCVASVCR
jgi:hypothetical protein